jgi:nitroreductase
LTITDTSSYRKPANANYPIHDLISERWSPRAFADRPVEDTKLRSVFEAARWAASAANLQPWYFIVASKENADDHAQLAATLWERNIVWAQNAPVLILVVAKLYERPGKEFTSFYDVGMAVGNLVTQAVHLGLITHQMGGFDADKAHASLGIPDGYQPLTMIALGYSDAPHTLPEPLRERELAPRDRKPQEEFVFHGQWNSQS